MLKLNNLSSPKGAHRNIKRIGRGQGSGQGTQAGKGHKGQKARSGGGIPIGFEGGQMPIYRRLPKKGFSNAAFRADVKAVSVSAIAKKFSSSEIVTKKELCERGVLKGADRRSEVKVILRGDEEACTLKFEGITKFSKTAREFVTANGGAIA